MKICKSCFGRVGDDFVCPETYNETGFCGHKIKIVINNRKNGLSFPVVINRFIQRWGFAVDSGVKEYKDLLRITPDVAYEAQEFFFGDGVGFLDSPDFNGDVGKINCAVQYFQPYYWKNTLRGVDPVFDTRVNFLSAEEAEINTFRAAYYTSRKSVIDIDRFLTSSYGQSDKSNEQYARQTVRLLRLSTGFSSKEFAEMLDRAESTVWSWETQGIKTRAPDMKTKKRILELFFS